MHPSHKILLDIMKSDAFRCTVFNTPFTIYTVIRIPIIFRVLWGPISEVMPRLRKIGKKNCQLKELQGYYIK